MSHPPRQPIPPKRAENLYCDETIDPPHGGDPFEESAPGVYHLNSIEVAQPTGRPTTFRTDLEPEDVKLVNELGRLTPDQLMEYIRHLQSNAFSLGIEEAKQFSKAKVLQIFKAKDV